MKVKDITGERFGKLVVIKSIGSDKHRKMWWLCQCDCGNQLKVSGCSLRKGVTQSCGCFQKEKTAERFATHKHTGERIYRIWTGMKKRCDNPNYRWYSNYGGRGITVCNDWQTFEPFYEWSMANGYNDNLTLYRIDVEGNYEPSNCRWVNMTVQNNNKRTNHLITFNNETHTMKEWGRILGIKYSILERRINKYKWPIQRAFKEGA